MRACCNPLPRGKNGGQCVRNRDFRCEFETAKRKRSESQRREFHVSDSSSSRAGQVIAEKRDIQSEVNSPSAGTRSSGATQAGARRYPEPPFPQQRQLKPGEEATLDPAPMFDAPFYRGSGKLQDKVAIVTGGDSGIGRSVAVLFAREGANVAVVYLAEHIDAQATQAAVEKEGRRCLLISGDVRDRRFCRIRPTGRARK